MISYALVMLASGGRHANAVTHVRMSYSLMLQCGCVVYVACDPKTHLSHTRVIETRGARCRNRRHEVGLRLFLWELLPDPDYRPAAGVRRKAS